MAYGTDLELARKTMIETVRGVEGVLPNQQVEALFLEFGTSALIFRVRWWLNSTRIPARCRKAAIQHSTTHYPMQALPSISSDGRASKRPKRFVGALFEGEMNQYQIEASDNGHASTKRKIMG